MTTLRQLRYLDALARTGHFGHAADEVSVTQPALSMQIKELEEALGVPLVERLPRGARLTPDGVEIAARARRILEDVRDLEAVAQSRAGLLAGTLRLGVIPSVAPYLLPRLLATLSRQYPDLDLHINETQTARLVEMLLAGGLDLLLLALPIPTPGVATRPLFDDPFLLAAPTTAPETADPYDLLAREPILLLEDGHCLRDQALSFCAERAAGGVDPYGASTLATVIQMVAAGLGVTLLPQMAASVETGRAAAIRLQRFPLPEPARSIGLAWRETSPRAADFAAFGDAVLSSAAPDIAGD